MEFAAELHDLIASDVRRNYGIHLARLARITLYDVASRVLGGFEKGLAEYVCLPVPDEIYLYLAEYLMTDMLSKNSLETV